MIELTPARRALPPSGRCRTRRTTSRCCASRCPRRSRRRASTPERCIGIATDFTACSPLPHATARVHARSRHACRSCGSTTRRSGQADRINAARRASRGWRATAGASPPSGQFAKALQLLEEEPELYARDGPLDRGRGLDRLAAVRARDAQRRARRATRRIHQDGALSRAARSCAALDPRFADFVEDKLDGPLPAAGGPRRRPDRPRRRPGRACGPGSRWRSATSTPTSPRPRPRRSSPASC